MKQEMSSRDWRFRLKDILQAIEKIDRYLIKTSISDFKKNDIAHHFGDQLRILHCRASHFHQYSLPTKRLQIRQRFDQGLGLCSGMCQIHTRTVNQIITRKTIQIKSE